MQTRNLMGCLVETDLLATQKWYSQANAWGCNCGHCRNFLAHARGNLLPDSARTVLKVYAITLKTPADSHHANVNPV